MNPNQPELLPCPFCGGKVKLENYTPNGMVKVYYANICCDKRKCDIKPGAFFKSMKKITKSELKNLINKWNTRAK